MRGKKTTHINFIKKINETKKALIPKKIISSSKPWIKGVRAFSFNPPKWLATSAAIFFIVLVIAFFLGFIYQKLYYDKFFAGVKLAGLNLNGKTLSQARQEIINRTDKISREGIPISYRDKTIYLTAISSAESPDTSFDLFCFDSESSLREAFAVGREKNLFINLKERLGAFILFPDYPIKYHLNEKIIKESLRKNFSEFEKKAEDAEISYENEKISIKNERVGKIFNYDEIVNNIKQRLAYLNKKPIKIYLQTDYPNVYQQDGELLKKEIKNALDLAPIELTAIEEKNNNLSIKLLGKNEGWEIDKDQLIKFIAIKRMVDNPDNVFYFFINKKYSYTPFLDLKRKKVDEYLQKEIAPFTDIKPIEAKFIISGSKVKEFQPGKSGQKLNTEKTYNALKKFILENEEKEKKPANVGLIIEKIENEITNESVNDLGIKEIIGVGESNFSGSPNNRRHNIKMGADSLHGILIKPKEEFSLNNALGEIDKNTGYLPELVIKENKTIPEYGGGLCQIGTTMFRAALNSGLPITMRRNHSYRVRYYEPAGTDATIYSPWPDLKFINDTGQHILVQSRIEGDNLYFEFWGTKDGRKITWTDSKIYNITKPPPVKTTETTELEPGEKKCTEHAVNGADAHFDYVVEYPSGEKKEERFFSHYRPWQEVCLIGVEATSTPEGLNKKTIN